MYSKSHNIEIMINDKAVKVNKKVFEWVFFSRCQIRLQESMKVSDFIFDYIHL